MKATLLAIATQRSALIERMQNVASTRPAAAKPSPSVTEKSPIRFSFLLRWARETRLSASKISLAPVRRAQFLSCFGARELGLMRQLLRTAAAGGLAISWRRRVIP